MNCDEAFELMTHPTEHHCEELLWHLELCPRCQHMQETLAPALDPLQQMLNEFSEADQVTGMSPDYDSPRDQESTPISSPAGKPFLSAETVRMAEQAATRLTAETGVKQPLKSKFPKKRLLHAALILLAGFLMGWVISLDVPENQMPMGMNSLQKPQSCLWIAQAESPAQQSTDTGTKKVAANSVVLSCVACHLQSTADLKPVSSLLDVCFFCTF